MDPSGAIECRYRKYGQRSQILSVRDGPWHAVGSQFCPCVLVGVLVVYVVLVPPLLFVCAFFRSQIVAGVTTRDGGGKCRYHMGSCWQIPRT